MKRQFLRSLVILCVLASVEASAATYKWAGGRSPSKKGDTPGKQGDFILLASPDEWVNVVGNVQRRLGGPSPWVTWAVGPLKEKAAAITDEQRRHEEHLLAFDKGGIDVFLEIWPGKGENVAELMGMWLEKFGKHPSIAGFSVDLEWHRGIDDTTAEAWDKALKAKNPKYRLMLKHWDVAAMPSAYAKKSDVICVNMSSELELAAMAKEFAAWANALAPGAVAFQVGYPWDESWWKDLKDPIKDTGNALLEGVTSPTQEIGFLWVTTKSSLTAGWDMTRTDK
jgi:hypothetical protein